VSVAARAARKAPSGRSSRSRELPTIEVDPDNEQELSKVVEAIVALVSGAADARAVADAAERSAPAGPRARGKNTRRGKKAERRT
jgi:hypothetical protein